MVSRGQFEWYLHISLHYEVFDEIALDYRAFYSEPIPVPFIFLGIWIKTADRGKITKDEALIIRDDIPQTSNQPATVSFDTVHRCGYCGNLVNEYGYTLEGSAYEVAVERWKEYGEDIFIKTHGQCCKGKEW